MIPRVAVMSMLLVVLFAVRGASNYISAVAMAAVSSRLVRDLRAQMYAKLIALPSSTLNVSTPGKLVSKITYDATQLTEAATKVGAEGGAQANVLVSPIPISTISTSSPRAFSAKPAGDSPQSSPPRKRLGWPPTWLMSTASQRDKWPRSGR